MELASWKGGNSVPTPVRSLTEDEIKAHERHAITVSQARNRLALFRMLEKNYAAFRNFILDLLDARYKKEEDEFDEVHRLILNYLAFSYALFEHYRTWVRREFGRGSEQDRGLGEYINLLESKSKDFAFMRDFRNYMQHVALGISNFKRNETHSSVEVVLSARASELIEAAPRCWKSSKIRRDDGDIDLIESMRGFHIDMLMNYGGHVAKLVAPELEEADSFYGGLTMEALHQKPGVKMVFLPQGIRKYEQDGVEKLSIDVVFAPNDVISHVGLKRGSR